MFRKTSIAMGKALYNCAKTVSHTPSIKPAAEPPSLEEINNAVLEWKKKNPDFSLPPGKSVIPPLRDVPEEYRRPTLKWVEEKENRTPKQKQLDLAYGDEHNI